MATESFRSKHAGKPGSLLAIRVDYPLVTNAFESIPADDPRRQRRAEVKKFTSGLRIGEKPCWNGSTVDELHPFPSHSPQRTLSEFQGVRMEYNYRANALPSFRDTIFLRKPNKMQIDESLFLSSAERAKIVPRCPGTNATLSRREIQNQEGLERESGWNNGTQPPEDRNSIFHTKKEASFVEVNKRKNLLPPGSYLSPTDRFSMSAESSRLAKLKARHDALGSTVAAASGASSVALGSSTVGADASRRLTVSDGGTLVVEGAPKTFKVSNMADWWNKDPTATVTSDRN